MPLKRQTEVLMKKLKEDSLLLINMAFLLITAVINVYGYFHLPDKIATQISFHGTMDNMMQKEIYLVGGFAIMCLLTFVNRKGTKESRIKYTIVNAIIMVANIVMIAIQL
jgi:uncharacterized membrane protein